MASLLAQVYRLIPRPITRFLLWAISAKFNFGAVGMFLAPDGRLLVLRHVYRHKYAWGLPGGYLNRGETPAEGLLRELREETALAATITGVFDVEEVDAFQKEVVFIGAIDPTQTPQLNHEIYEATFVALDALPDGMLPRHAALIARYRASIR
jgi:8-oxo-dGTP diphosphatase